MAKRKPVRVVFDTNVLLSFLIGKRLGPLYGSMMGGAVQLVISDLLIRELTETAKDPKFRRYFTSEVVQEMLFVLGEAAEQFVVKPPFLAVCRDAKDDHVLALCHAGRAHLLVSGDEDLLALGKHGRTRIISPKEFGILITH